ncbi:hypothetical protein FLAG1_04487 [Fusarium langsethiae]|uniref:Uncharacterized protein n=1 Tax=Fusarium langsethiae TaxID=179993 RepID=A0A0M9EZD5_FUSLA|nr:hypothetical protein FLAG1_04487 [Fusarium langsethiae]GKU04326.1 unnamed protein product [Fusarium langsethiae]GKU17843.1 unnamed protein product [Fusarium langsethiae]
MTRAAFEAQSIHLEPRAISTELSTCGYLNGDPDKERTADPGFNCRVDARNGLWGFCPTSVLTASDCGLAGFCIDRLSCSTGCGMTNTDLTTFTCGRGSFCSTAILTFGIDQVYSYIACGNKNTVENYLVTPLSAKVATTTTEQTISQEQTSTVDSSDTTSATIETVEETSTQASSSSSEEKSSGSPPNNLGPIIGGVIGGLTIVCATTIGAIYLLRRNRKRDKADSPKQDTPKAFSIANEVAPQELQGGWSIVEMPAQQKSPVELA